MKIEFLEDRLSSYKQKELHLPAHLVYLKLGDAIFDKELPDILKFLQAHPEVTGINLANSNIRLKGLQYIAENFRIPRIILTNNSGGVDTESFLALLNNTSILRLELGRYWIPSAILPKVEKVLSQRQPRLEHILVGGVDIEPDADKTEAEAYYNSIKRKYIGQQESDYLPSQNPSSFQAPPSNKQRSPEQSFDQISLVNQGLH